MAAPEVVCVGLHIVDILGRPVVAIPAGQNVALVDEIRMTVAGTAAATAVDLARLGVAVGSVGSIGDDDLGRWLRGRMAEEGVDVTHLTVTGEAQTSATVLPIRPDGERPALHVIGASAALRAEHIDLDAFEGVQVLHLGGTYLLPALDGRPTADLLAAAKRRGMTTTLDLIGVERPDAARILEPCLPFVDHLMPNLDDAARIAGTTERAETIAWFLERGVSHAVLSLGADGVSVTSAGGSEAVVPAYAVDVVDTTGSGDALSAGYIAGLLEGREPAAAAELGVACGSLVTTGLGSDAGLIDRDGLERFMAATPRRRSRALSLTS